MKLSIWRGEVTDDGVSIDDFMILVIACLKGVSKLCHRMIVGEIWSFIFLPLRQHIKFNGMTFRLKTLVEC